MSAFARYGMLMHVLDRDALREVLKALAEITCLCGSPLRELYDQSKHNLVHDNVCWDVSVISIPKEWVGQPCGWCLKLIFCGWGRDGVPRYTFQRGDTGWLLRKIYPISACVCGYRDLPIWYFRQAFHGCVMCPPRISHGRLIPQMPSDDTLREFGFSQLKSHDMLCEVCLGLN